MMYCILNSLVEKDVYDIKDHCDKYRDWMNNGYCSSTGDCFDIGFTTRDSLLQYSLTGEVFSGYKDNMSSGNGSIMRLAPTFIYAMVKKFSLDKTLDICGTSSKTTHGSDEALTGCRFLGAVLYHLYKGGGKHNLKEFLNDNKYLIMDDLNCENYK